jgi:hypothetical protein
MLNALLRSLSGRAKVSRNQPFSSSRRWYVFPALTRTPESANLRARLASASQVSALGAIQANMYKPAVAGIYWTRCESRNEVMTLYDRASLLAFKAIRPGSVGDVKRAVVQMALKDGTCVLMGRLRLRMSSGLSWETIQPYSEVRYGIASIDASEKKTNCSQTYLPDPTTSKILTHAPNHMHAREVTSERFQVQRED